MKKIFLLLLLTSFTLFSQNSEKNWAKIIQFENEGKIKSASRIVEKIYKKAMANNDEVQIIKCFFYQSKYMQTLEENAQSKILDNLKTNINRVSIPLKAILRLVYAKCLTDYLKQNNLFKRSQIQSDSLGSFLTWTRKDFSKEIEASYEQSIENESLLKSIPLNNYDAVFDYLAVEKFKKETLFDYVIKENIAFFTSKINQWEAQPADFESYKTALLGSSDDFKAVDFGWIKNESLKKVLLLFQKQEATDPSVENQLQRIQFCYSYILRSDADFLKSLTILQKKTNDVMLLQKIQLEKATIYSKLASKELHPDYNIKAISILDSITTVNNRSNTYKLALLKKREIVSKTLSVQLQKYVYPYEYTRAFVNYENADNLKISFYKINQKTLASFENTTTKADSLVTAVVKKNQALKSVQHTLPNKKNYFGYSTEILLPQLELGSYLVYFESDSNTETEKAFAYETMTVSNFTLLANSKDNIESYQVLDRKTGMPIENVSLKSSKFNIRTNENGVAIFNAKDIDTYLRIELTKANDTLQINNGYLTDWHKYSNDEEDDDDNFKSKVEFYLDRAIYRPGQTVYYKGIAIQNKRGKDSVVPNLLLKITIEDADDDELKEFEVTTNEYGSFSGEFVLPKSGLTGEFRITADEPDDVEKDPLFDKKEDEHPFWDNVDFENSSTSFKVEEYKRPKFEILFDPIKESYLVNQKIKVTGKAKAYSGSTISDAKVTYTISRETYDSSRNHYNSNKETITTDETTTDTSGNFTINFTAAPQESAIKENLPVFSYTVEATVVDSNGETRSNETIVKVGYHSLVLKALVPYKIQTKNKNSIYLNSTNLNEEFVAIKGDVKIYFLGGIQNKFKARVWNKPEIESISNEEFEKLFPYEINEKPLTGKEIGTLVYSQKVNTLTDKALPLNFISKYKSGQYRLVFSTVDILNTRVETSSVFQLTQSNNTAISNQWLTVEQINADPKKDGFVELKLSSNIPELYILAVGNYQSKTFFDKNITLKKYQTTIKIPLEEEFTNSVKIGFETIFENQYFKSEIQVMLKSAASKMQFEVESLRNKIEPGSIENWSFKLLQNDPLNEAEIVASMYDSSLDQFTKKDWDDIAFPPKYNLVAYKASLGFHKTTSYIINLNPVLKQIELNNESSKLIWFGFDFNNSDTYLIQKQYKKQVTKKSKKPLNAKMISGVVTEGGLPLPGANVVVKGTTRGVQTDVDGYYEIEAALREVLVFSFVGMTEIIETVTDNREINVRMKEDGNSLSEVVVTSFGIKRKQSALTSSTQVTALAGKVSGLNSSTNVILRGYKSITGDNNALVVINGVISPLSALDQLSADSILDIKVLKGAEGAAIYGSQGANGVLVITTKEALQELTQVKARANLSETAFFFPHLKPDNKGKVSFSFTSPEALTSWKLRLLAHNKNANLGYLEKSIITQKDLMVTPNFPRFFREKDTIVITSKIANVTSEVKTGIAVLQLFDATTMQPVDSKTLNTNTIKNFSVAAFGNTTVSWKIYIPEGLQGIQYKVLAKSGNFSDGEENILPVLTNTILVTESIPVWVRANTKKEYVFDNLKNNTSTTLQNHQLTLEYTSNPTWLAIQSLPYLMEYEHECAEQTFARYYANALATEIINSNPKIAAVFESWRKNGKLTSKLEQNEELKSIILAETPWFQDAQTEDEKKKNLAVLFDLEKMKNSQEATFDKLKQKQKSSGGFSWFDGSDESEYITRHILAGFGHLKKLNVKTGQKEKIDEIAKTGIPFIDGKFLETHKRRTDALKGNAKLVWLNPNSDLHYLYTRSFYLESNPVSNDLKIILKSYLEQIKETWLSYTLYEKGLAALTLHRFEESAAAKKILESLKDTAANNDEIGMYWTENKAGWYWYQAPIETQALLIEAFTEISHDTKSADAMKVWLLKEKQNKNWPTTKSTTEAVYALLLQGSDWSTVKDNTVIKIGSEKIMTKKLSENEKEAETGYIKLNWKADEITKEMAVISIENKSKIPGYGGVYWQYFEELDKIKSNVGNVMLVSKELYLKKNTSTGPQLQRIKSNNPLKIGDLVTVRLVISTKEDMEYVHLKDMRAAAFEPVDVLSEYQWKNGLGFYQSTKDVATHFFFDRIPKGTYVLEYDIRVNNKGNFSNGITTIQSMYAPEFTSHTKGIRVQIAE